MKKNEEMIDLIPDYLDNLLDIETKKEFELQLSKSGELVQELEAFKRLLKAFDNEPQIMPSENLRKGFETMLA